MHGFGVIGVGDGDGGVGVGGNAGGGGCVITADFEKKTFLKAILAMHDIRS